MTPNLTQLEIRAINAPLNAADGHARQSLSEGQLAIVTRFPELFREAQRLPIEVLERRAHEAFFGSLGQSSAPVGTGRILSAYSSSVAMDLLARCLANTGASVALIHPTFDNIPDLLRSRNIRLIPFEEVDIAVARFPDSLRPGDCVFVTVPNNPTGNVLALGQIAALAEGCVQRGLTLALDTSFRGFDRRAQEDYYSVL